MTKGFCSKDCPCLEGKVDQSEGVMMAINGGCLPDGGEIRSAVHFDSWWECHSRPGVICSGAIEEAKKHNIGIPDKPTAGETFGHLYGRQ